MFAALSFSDSGKYFCIVTNEAGSDTSTIYTLVPVDTMPKPPAIIGDGQVNVFGTLQSDSSFGIYITATGTEPIKYKWYKNDSIVPNVSDDTLYFPALAFVDSGQYFCIARNDWGIDSSKVFKLHFDNFAPHWLHDTLHLNAREDSSFTLNLTDSCIDINNNTISFFPCSVSAPLGDTIIKDTYSFTPNFSDAGIYPFSLGAHDKEDTSYCTIILNVTDVNQPPQFLVDDSLPAEQYVVAEGGTLSIPFKAIDNDDDSIWYFLASTTLPDSQSIIWNDSLLLWPSGINSSGEYNVVIGASDSTDETLVTVKVYVGDININPVITIKTSDSSSLSENATVWANEGKPLQLKVSVSDLNSNDTTVLLQVQNAPYATSTNGTGSYDTAAGIFTYTPDFSVSSKTTNNTFSNILFLATDNNAVNALDTFIINIQVLDSNRSPVAVNESFTSIEDSTATIDVLANDSDPDSDSLILASAGQGKLGVTSISNNKIVYVPTQDIYGKDTISYVINDIAGASVSAFCYLDILPSNDAPSFIAGNNIEVDENSGKDTVTNWAQSINPGATNESVQTIQFITTVTSDTGSVLNGIPYLDPNNGHLSFEIINLSHGLASISIFAKDDGGTANGGTANGGIDSSSSQTFTITVNDVNFTPHFVVPDSNTSIVTINEGTSIDFPIIIADNDQTVPILDVSGNPVWVTTVDNGNGDHTMTISPWFDVATNANPTYSGNIIIKAIDSQDNTKYVLHTIVLTVNNVIKTAPVFEIQPGDTTAPLGEIYFKNIKAKDFLGSYINLTLSGNPAGMSYDHSTQTITWNVDREKHTPGSSYTITASSIDTLGQISAHSWDVTVGVHVWKWCATMPNNIWAFSVQDSQKLLTSYSVNIAKTHDGGKNWGSPLNIAFGVSSVNAYRLHNDKVFINTTDGTKYIYDCTSLNATDWIKDYQTYSMNSYVIDYNAADNKFYTFYSWIPTAKLNEIDASDYNTDTLDIGNDQTIAWHIACSNEAGLVYALSNQGVFRKGPLPSTDWNSVYTNSNGYLINTSKFQIINDTIYTIGLNNSIYKCIDAKNSAISFFPVNSSALNGLVPEKIVMTGATTGWIKNSNGDLYFTNDGFTSVFKEVVKDPGSSDVPVSDIEADSNNEAIFLYGNNYLFQY